MYQHLRGKVLDLTPASATLEVAGVGYDVRIPTSTFRAIEGREAALLHVHLHVREDEWRLYGFATVAERDFFRVLLSVTGVGPGVALAILCGWGHEEVARAIAEGDTRALQSIKGVGRKLAERLVVELRDRVGAAGRPAGRSGAPTGAAAGPPPADEADDSALPDAARTARRALVHSLGFERDSALTRVTAALEALGRDGASEGAPDAGSIVKWCLRHS